MILDNEGKNTVRTKRKRSMPLSWAIALILVVALAGGLAYYFQVEKNRELIALSEQAIADQQHQTMVAFDQIEKNLAEIRKHESMIRQNFSGEENKSKLSPEERIQKEIDFIQYLLDENKNIIAGLEDKLDEKDARLSAYEKTVKDLKTRVSEYQLQLDNLVAANNDLQKDLHKSLGERDELAGQVNQLGLHLETQDSVIAAQKMHLKETEDVLYSAYYTVGTYKDLRDRDVLTKEGGFLGINRVKTLVDNPSTAQFERIDIREISSIPIFSEHFEIINDRDPSSYEVEYANDLAEWLTIKDPEKFWKKSPYLVIVVRNDNNSELAQSR